MTKIKHDRDVCIGCGACASLCHKYWEMSEDGKSTLKGAVLDSDAGSYNLEVEEVECNQKAADACPVQCIIINKE